MIVMRKNLRRTLFTAIACAGFLFIISCKNHGANSNKFSRELLLLGLGKYVNSIPYISHAPYPEDPTWEIYEYDTSICKCVLGAPFHIGVKKKTGTANVVFNMSGGGACWPGKDSCAKTADYLTGWNDSTGNPLNGWSVVHVPYCDGSVHMGDNDADYDNDTIPDHYHRGLKMTTAGIEVMRELFPNPPKIFITGCSAGGYGTFIAYLLLKNFFPGASIYIFNDSGPGLWNPDNGMKQLVMDAWQYRPHFPSNCTQCDDQVMYLYKWMLQNDPQVRIGLFSAYNDRTIGGSFLSMTPGQYQSLLFSTSAEIHGQYPDRFKRYLINGTTHCVSEAAGNYSYIAAGQTYSIVQWLGHLVNDNPAWTDVFEVYSEVPYP